MTRRSISDGRWFDEDRATKLGSSRNRNDFRWCDLYRTAGGSFVFAHITCWQGERDRYEPATPEESAAFLIEIGKDLPPDLLDVAAATEA